MKDNLYPIKTPQASRHGSFKSYGIGFALSLVLTLAAYIIVQEHLLTGKVLVVALVSLGVMQALIQLLFFLHLKEENKPRWNLVALAFMIGVIAILVVGSLWIMNDLDERLMSMQAMFHPSE
ncbi:cytochrome o ubiquinol oxidase subunit IV [Neochlamydia sp. AcF95]|uniref:cytochrome o ubiquinol oxidase subunit IV n=1 Tax=Neochlamydia sp. AcF95 TaxID=2795734 RepID=UPI001BCA15BD|nr:cytochrome o ubiquinol oxidase subunit IV [Neochlamydia sp. AcF95]MBS4170948.1 Cytochrome bo(3) ubiquinol oxidase subunit 4 [Neochlamydia sp. AcF95]